MDKEILLDSSPQNVVENIYEHPFGEKIKLLLRLEIIFKQAFTYQCSRNQHETQMCLDSLFALLNLTKRYELRSLLLKELERIHVTLSSLRQNEGIDQVRNEQTIEEISVCKKLLHSVDSKHIERMRNIDFLKAIKLRNIHEIGTYLFEVPELQHWLLQDASHRENQVKIWLEDFKPFKNTTDYLLKLLRDTVVPETLVADSGIYIKDVESRRTVNQLLRIKIKNNQKVYPSISGDGYRYVVRFMDINQLDGRSYQAKKTVEFELSSCGI